MPGLYLHFELGSGEVKKQNLYQLQAVQSICVPEIFIRR
ncbi:Hypothetical protein Minf_2314 [Methylacidiphilum infernorum V4]|uniref:Uncharacterized protein n=1 Tax=Methylacidiphilum infernorum (isolate V4) TaxID=481448 RepID=B3E0D9_METI4|nr:Hypothetical protein Minf_2314 [Methylacidiphilum infernorum V4]